LRDLINKEAPTEVIKEAAVESGMKTLLAYSLMLVKQGLTTLEEVDRVTLTDKGLESELKARAKGSQHLPQLWRGLACGLDGLPLLPDPEVFRKSAWHLTMLGCRL
jgi:hypothetical protein